MKMKLLLAVVLASALAFAQESGQQPSTQQQPSAQQPTAGQTQTGAGPTSISGCLQQSGENFVIVTAEGQSTPVKGDASMLQQHNGHQVQANGSQASDGSFQVTDVVMIAETCGKPQASESGAGAAAGAAAAGAAAGAAATGAATGTAGAAESAAQGAAQPAQTTPGAAEQTPPPATAPSAAEQKPGTETGQPPATVEQPGKPAAGKAAGQKLPQTASPLPLLGLLGLGSLVSGLIARKK